MHVLLALCLLLITAATTPAAEILNEVKARQMLRCGISVDSPGLAAKDERGEWAGIEVDFCKAVAAAVLEDSTKVALRPLPLKARFSSLLSKEVDLLARNTSQTIGRQSQLGVLFVGPLCITGQTFMVHDDGPRDLADVLRAPVCVLRGTTHVQNLEDLALKNGAIAQPLLLDNGEQAWQAFVNRRCSAITEDATLLAGGRLRFATNDQPLRLFPDLYTRELTGLAVLQSDPQWFVTLQAILSALITAEEIGLRAEILHQPQGSVAQTAEMQIFLKRTDQLAPSLGLSAGWASRVIGTVGHYGELFERNLGAQGPLKLDRGPNRLVKDGGMLFAVPF